jgi:predicted nucleic acid-binding Zn ribbon protein
VAPDDDALREEVVRLRDWRHNVAAPELSAAIARAKQLSADLLVVERRLKDVETQLARMARADEIAEAVTTRLAENTEQSKKIRRGRLNAWEQIVVGTAAVAGTVSVALQIIHR